MNSTSGILAGSFNDVVWLRIEGRGSFQNSTDLKRFVQSRIERGERSFAIDLGHCTGMDSTFMGTLTCVAARLLGEDGQIQVVNACGRNGELLRGLGLHEIFPVDDGSAGMAGALPDCGCGPAVEETMPVPQSWCSKTEQTEVCLEAHEALAGVDAANARKFKNVIELMRESLEAAGAAG